MAATVQQLNQELYEVQTRILAMRDAQGDKVDESLGTELGDLLARATQLEEDITIILAKTPRRRAKQPPRAKAVQKKPREASKKKVASAATPRETTCRIHCSNTPTEEDIASVQSMQSSPLFSPYESPASTCQFDLEKGLCMKPASSSQKATMWFRELICDEEASTQPSSAAGHIKNVIIGLNPLATVW